MAALQARHLRASPPTVALAAAASSLLLLHRQTPKNHRRQRQSLRHHRRTRSLECRLPPHHLLCLHPRVCLMVTFFQLLSLPRPKQYHSLRQARINVLIKLCACPGSKYRYIMPSVQPSEGYALLQARFFRGQNTDPAILIVNRLASTAMHRPCPPARFFSLILT